MDACAGVSGVEIAVFPPFTHLSSVFEVLSSSTIGLGAQDVAATTWGALTGAVSAQMVVDYCDYALVGHSERRHLFGESEETVAAKLVQSVDAKLTVLLAVGETEEERDAGRTHAVIDRQLGSALGGAVAASPDQLVVAYEPVWAIGTGKTATPEVADGACAHVSKRLGELVHEGERVRVLYGGSLNGENAQALFEQPHIDGGLPGGASLKSDSFSAIVRAAAAATNSSTLS